MGMDLHEKRHSECEHGEFVVDLVARATRGAEGGQASV